MIVVSLYTFYHRLPNDDESYEDDIKPHLTILKSGAIQIQ